MEKGSLKGRTAIVTGASSGIGRGSASVLAGAGAQVVIADIDDEGGSETVRLIRAAGGTASYVHADVASRGSVQALIASTLATYGGLDIMHANTGITLYVDLEDMLEADMDRLLGVNLKGALLCAQISIPVMKSRGGGSIVFTSSVLNTIGFPQCVVYSSTKAALIGLTRTLAVEVGKHNIRVNCVSPGTINTPMLDRDMADMNVDEAADFRRRVREANALGRVGEPDEVGEAVAWLSSDSARYITGQNLYVDGAFTAVKRL